MGPQVVEHIYQLRNLPLEIKVRCGAATRASTMSRQVNLDDRVPIPQRWRISPLGPVRSALEKSMQEQNRLSIAVYIEPKSGTICPRRGHEILDSGGGI